MLNSEEIDAVMVESTALAMSIMLERYWEVVLTAIYLRVLD
jgi:hypothetical protein